jgi:type I restriction-modification system DNA methylase subunit
LQTSSYIRHKLILAGTSQIDTKHSFSLSTNSNVLENSFDVAFTLLEPKESNTVNSNEKLNLIRLEKDTVPSKFKEHGFIQHILYSLKDDGIGIVFIGKGPLNRVAESNARKFLLENNFVDAVIQLPPKLITSRTVPLFALILRKNRKPKQPVKFINATSFSESEGTRNKLTNLKLLAKTYHAKSNKENFVSLVLSRDISTDGYPLNVSNYVSSDFNEEREDIDLIAVRKALQKQQMITDDSLSKLNRYFKV